MKINKKAILPFIIAILIYLLAYQIPKITVPSERLHFLYCLFDYKIPLIPSFIYIYIGAFGQWSIAIFLSTKQSIETSYRFASSIIIGSLIAFMVFMIYPTAITRPEILGTDFASKFLNFIYSVDNIICACPSFHCFCSSLVVLQLLDFENTSKKVIIINLIYTILVYASTVFTKQHTLIDLPFGILLAFVAYYISKKITFTKLFDSLNEKLHIN